MILMRPIQHITCPPIGLAIFLLIVISAQSTMAQQHFSKGLSASIGKYLKNDGYHLTTHYHLNSFNELRFNVHSLKESLSDTLINAEDFLVKTNLIGFDYVVGFKPKKVLSTTLYLGGGALLGIEKSNAAELYPTKNLYGLNLLAELEIAPFPLFSFGLQYNYLLLNRAITNPQKIAIKARIYFQ